MTDLSKLSNEDLLAIQSGDMSKVSTAGLQHLAGSQPAPQPATPAPRQAAPASDNGMGRLIVDSFNGMLHGGPVGALINAGMGKERVDTAKDMVMTGTASIGNTLLTPVRWAADKIEPKQTTVKTLVTGEKTRPDTVMGNVADYLERSPEAAKSFDKQHEGDLFYTLGKLGTQVALTAPIGGAAGQLVSKAIPFAGPAAPFLKNLAAAIESGGMRTGANPTTLLAKAGDMATRVAGGAVNGGLTAGLVDPESAAKGAEIGAAIPVAAKLAGLLGQTVRKSMAVSPETAQLAKRADELGIKVPADRIANSRPLNAAAASLNYIPFSGRTATEGRMADQLNTALSRTFGQDSPNINKALQRASDELGAKFDGVLKNTTIKVSDGFLERLAAVEKEANSQLVGDAQNAINKQISNIMEKAGTGQIDGQAAYNIKRTLDRMARGAGPDAFHAKELRGVIMSGLDESLGPVQAKAFAETRKQYGNMLALEKIAQNGAEGDISIARLANMRNINNPDLQELADIAAQFLKGRESAHGAMQRVAIGGAMTGAGAVSAPLVAGGTVAAGRVANTMLNSNALRNLMVRIGESNGARAAQSAAPGAARIAEDKVKMLSDLFARSAPVVITQAAR